MRRALLPVLSVLALAAGLQAWVSHEQRRLGAAPRGGGCVACHAQVEGLEASHADLGCLPCHLGDGAATGAEAAHRGMVSLPGQLADVDRTCGRSGCHEAMPLRLKANVMTTMNGVVSVDRWLFGEQPTPSALTPVSGVGTSPADTHLRNLCASCHLDAVRTRAGPLTELTRGGGCNACHLRYSPAAVAALGTWKKGAAETFVHPALSARPEPVACFGCHSRSGRISLDYQGWEEFSAEQDQGRGGRCDRVLPGARPPQPTSCSGNTEFSSEEAGGEAGHLAGDAGCAFPASPAACSGNTVFDGDAGAAALRRLEDGRTVRQGLPDVHFERGLQCVDCHGSWEVMGTGAVALHAEQQATVRCDDCHRAGPGPTAPLEALDPESARVAALEGLAAPGRRYLLQARGGAPLVNAFEEDGGLALQAKYTGARLALKAPAPDCTRGTAHQALSCPACHDAWAPQCVSCHTAYEPGGTGYDLLARAEVHGAWEETGGQTFSEPASLGVRVLDGGVRRVVEFAPGMILTLAPGPGQPTRFRRLFAPVAPHTTRREARTCASCHQEPLALGYGRGTLSFDGGAVAFTARLPARPEDGLPADAWLGFLQVRGPESTTREDTRPFTPAEQRRILTVGACLDCHRGDSAVMRRGLADFGAVLARRTARCRSPSWR